MERFGENTPNLENLEPPVLKLFGDNKEKSRTPEEQRELERKIFLIARIFSRQYEMSVVPGAQWACGLSEKANELISRFINGEQVVLPENLFKPSTITYNRADLDQEEEDEIIGKIRHEVGHANHSDYRLLAEGMKFAKEDGYLPTSWLNITNAIEDPRVNNLEIADSEVVRQKIAKLYESWRKDVTEKIGSQPVTRQLGLDIIHYWLTGEGISTLKNPEVSKVFNEIKGDLDNLFNNTSASTSHQQIKEKIWNKYKVLEKFATDDEKLKQMMQAAAGDLAKQLSGGGEGGDGQPEGEGGGLLSRIKKALGGGEDKDLEKDLSEQIDQKTKKEIGGELTKQLKKRQEEKKEKVKSGEQEGQKEKGLPEDIDLGEIPDNLKKKLKDIINSLPEELKKKLAKKARQELDKKQAKSLENDLPKIIKLKKDKESGEYLPSLNTADKDEIERAQEETAQIIKQVEQDEAEANNKREREEAEVRNQQEAVAKKLREIKEMLDYGFRKDERDQYLKFKELENSMRSQVESFLKILDRYLPKKEEYAYSGQFYSGRKPDLKKLATKVPIKRYDIFRRREVKESSEAKLYATLLIDNSGSMGGEKTEESLKTTIFFARVLKRFDIPFNIKFFGDQVVTIKNFDDDYDDSAKRIKPDLVKKADASGGSTNISEPLSLSEEEMNQAKRQFPGSYGVIFVISDGGANQGLTGSGLVNYVEKLQKTYGVNAFGLGSGAANELKGYFGEHNTVAVDDFSQLPSQAFAVLRVSLERILKRLRSV